MRHHHRNLYRTPHREDREVTAKFDGGISIGFEVQSGSPMESRVLQSTCLLIIIWQGSRDRTSQFDEAKGMMPCHQVPGPRNPAAADIRIDLTLLANRKMGNV